MNNAADVIALLEGKKFLTVVEGYATEEEKEYSVNFKREGPDCDDCTSNMVAALFDTRKKSRFDVPLDFDLIHGLSDLLQILSAFSGTGRTQVFRLYNVIRGKKVLSEEFRVSYTAQGPTIAEIAHAKK